MLRDENLKLNLLKVYGNSTDEIFQLTRNQPGSIYIGIFYLTNSSFVYKGSESVLLPVNSTVSYVDDPGNWSSAPISYVSPIYIMLQPIYSSDVNYYQLSLWLGPSQTVKLYKIDFSTVDQVKLLRISNISTGYSGVMVFFTLIDNNYWAFAYYYL